MQPTSGNKPRITIIGLGWLGQALAMRWQQHGGQVFGSCRTAEKRTQLQQQGVSAFTWQSGEPVELPSADCLVLTLPPSTFAATGTADYVSALAQCVQAAADKGYRQVIQISSTGVYGRQDSGRDDQPIHPDSERGQLLWRAEQAIRQGPLPWTILRSAGQIGPGRHPGRFLAGKTVSDGGAPVNLVHQQDLVTVLCALLERPCPGETFNLCAPDHPSREQFYTAACAAAGLPIPVFRDQSTLGLCIDGRRVMEVVGCHYAVTDLMAWLSVS